MIEVKDRVNLTIPELESIAEKNTQEYVYARLRNAIMVGAIPPNTALTMRGLAQEMSISPTPVREAIRRLSSEGAILIQLNRRISVPKMSLERFEELVALRMKLESHAAERALPYVSDVKVSQMVLIDRDMDKAVREKSYDQLTILNHAFHRVLYTTNPEPVSMSLIESVWLQLGPFQRKTLELVDEYYKVDRHKEIIEALRQRDERQLVRAIKNDIKDSTLKAGRHILLQTL